MRWDSVTALFGGSFDPPHRGHREAVRGLFEQPGVRAVRVLPTALAPHKSTGTSIDDRVAMVRLGFSHSFQEPYPAQDVEIDLIEIERARREPGPTYSFETLQAARALYGEIAFVIGTDQLRDLPTWSRFPALLGLCHWIVLARKPDGEKVAGETLREWVASGLIAPRGNDEFTIRQIRSASSAPHSSGTGAELVLKIVPTAAPALSSTLIRESLQKLGKAPDGALLSSVSSYLKEHHLYGS